MRDEVRRLRDIRGMRYPDDYVIRMFFKEHLDSAPGRVLELGCGSGNNLRLFQEFGWTVTGVDVDEKALENAHHNLSSVGLQLIRSDLSGALPNITGEFDCVLLPSVNYYIPRDAFIRLLAWLRPTLAPEAAFYLRSRLVDDWRFAKGAEVERNGYRLDCTETGEHGLLNVFYTVEELNDLLTASVGGLVDVQCLRVRYENPQSGVTIANSDVVIWGRLKPGSAS